MPYVSNAQRKFFHTDTARKAGITPADVKHWDEASKGKDLPEHVEKKSAFSGFVDAVRKYAGVRDVTSLVEKFATAMAASNALQTFTSAQKPLGVGVGASRGLTNPMGLGHGLNPTKGMAGADMGPRANPLAEASSSRGQAFDSLTQSAMQSPSDKMKDGATLPALV